MSVLIGFTIFLMLILLGYMSYRLYIRKNLVTLVTVSVQLGSASLCIMSFFNGVEAVNLIQAVYVLFGIIIPSFFLGKDYYIMLGNIKESGIYHGLVVRKGNNETGYTDITALRPQKKEIPAGEIIKCMKITDNELLKNMKNILMQAQTDINRREFEKASIIYKTTAKLVRNTPEINYNLAYLNFLTGEYNDSINHYEKAIDLYLKRNETDSLENLPDDRLDKTEASAGRDNYLIWTYYNLGNAYCKMKRYDSAVETYNSALELDGDFEEAHYNKAQVYVLKGELKTAAGQLKKLFDSKKDFSISFTLGKLYLEMKDFENAEEMLIKSMDAKPDCFETLEELAKLYFKRGNYTGAIDFFERAEKIKPGDYSFYSLKGSALYKTGKLADAEEAYRMALDLEPESYKTYFNLSNVLDDEDKKYDAVEALKKVIELKPDFIEAYNNLGIVLSTLGKQNDAIEFYKEGLKENPCSYSLYYNLGITLADNGDYEKAVEVFRKAIKLDKGQYELYCHLGAALVGLGRYDEAINEYNRAIEVKQPDSELFYSLASVYSLLRKKDIAIDNLKKAIELNGEHRLEAKSDRSFDSLKYAPEFRELVS